MYKLYKTKSGKLFLKNKKGHRISLENFEEFKDDVHWRRRMNRHKRYQSIYFWIIKKLALRLIKKSNFYQNKEYYINDLKIEFNPEGYDFYTSCDSRLKKWCQGGIKKYRANIGNISLYGETEMDLYLEIIGRFISRPIHVPFCKK